MLPFTLSACFLFEDGTEDEEESFGDEAPSPPADSFQSGGGFIGGAPGLLPIGEQPQRLAELRTSEHAARPISGGTLAVSADGRSALAADSDRDCVYVVHPDDLSTKKLQLPDGSEPGRVLLDASGAGHVVLRGTGKLVRVDLNTATVSAEATLCAQPRGLAYDASQDALVAACMDGQLVTVAASDYLEISRSHVAQDLRDVVVDGTGRTFVSRYRSAELVSLGLEGNVRTTSHPTSAHSLRFDADLANDARPPADAGIPLGFRDVTFSPALAWRSVAGADGQVWMLHQQSQDGEVAISTGGYGSGCAQITQGAVTRFGSDGTPQATLPIASAGLSVDIAVSANANWVAVASPGAYLQGGMTLQLYATTSMVTEITADSCTGPLFSAGDRSQIVAVAFDASGFLYSFSREPAELEVYSLGTSVSVTRVATIGLDRRSVRDTGHDMFHTDVGSGLSCASCHGEALDDGHVWNFRGIGARRTQNIRGGVLGTAPFHWDGDMRSFRQLVDDVMTGRMGGFPVKDEYASALGKWIDEQPALCAPAGDAAAVTRGKALFHADATGCASCHSGDALTNNQSADVGTGRTLQVPSLRGLGLRAPYMHNGCAKTLEQRFAADCGGGDKHGHTSQLSDAEITDLTAYLRTL